MSSSRFRSLWLQAAVTATAIAVPSPWVEAQRGASPLECLEKTLVTTHSHQFARNAYERLIERGLEVLRKIPRMSRREREQRAEASRAGEELDLHTVRSTLSAIRRDPETAEKAFRLKLLPAALECYSAPTIEEFERLRRGLTSLARSRSERRQIEQMQAYLRRGQNRRNSNPAEFGELQGQLLEEQDNLAAWFRRGSDYRAELEVHKCRVVVLPFLYSLSSEEAIREATSSLTDLKLKLKLADERAADRTYAARVFAGCLGTAAIHSEGILDDGRAYKLERVVTHIRNYGIARLLIDEIKEHGDLGRLPKAERDGLESWMKEQQPGIIVDRSRRDHRSRRDRGQGNRGQGSRSQPSSGFELPPLDLVRNLQATVTRLGLTPGFALRIRVLAAITYAQQLRDEKGLLTIALIESARINIGERWIDIEGIRSIDGFALRGKGPEVFDGRRGLRYKEPSPHRRSLYTSYADTDSAPEHLAVITTDAGLSGLVVRQVSDFMGDEDLTGLLAQLLASR